MTVTWKKLAYRADVLPDLLSPYAVGDLLYANSTTTLAKLADVAVGSYLKSSGIGVIPAWATLNQAAVAGLTTADGPSFAHLHLADVAAIYTAAESWIGPSSTTGIYFKGGLVGIGTATPTSLLQVNGVTSIVGGAAATSGLNGLHLYFDSNVGYINATHYGTANRDLSIISKTLSITTQGALHCYINVDGLTRLHYYGAGAASFDASGNLVSASDERLKIILGKYTGGIAQLNGIEPIVHKWNHLSGMETEHQYIGFSAQNVQKYMPEAVYKHKETGILSYTDKAVIAVLVNAVKQHEVQIQALQAQLN